MTSNTESELLPCPITVKISQEGDKVVAECFPFDVVTQGENLMELLTRLRDQFEAEIHVAGSMGEIPTRTQPKAEPTDGAPETRTSSEILRDPDTYEMVETILYLTDDGHLTETPTKTVAGVFARKDLSDARIAELEAALKPFADCADQIDPHEDGGEWAKFRLLVDDYRTAERALKSEGEG